MEETPRLDRPDGNEEVLLFPASPRVTFVQLRESPDDIEEDAADPALLFWILALLFFGLGDTISSFLVFSKGGSELNPLMRLALRLPGELLGFVFVKTVALSVLYAMAHFWEGPHRWMIPIVMAIAGVYLTVNNITVYLGR
ncbi:MAG: hypothetical protein HY683_04610 [Chloroflexi bacterium]|nr:hypothetical protein [Chloroflexota bacterium]